MTVRELQELTLAQAIALLSRGEISQAELRAAVAQQIERLNPDVLAFITVMDRPKAGDRQGASPPPGFNNPPQLHGAPVSVKDLFDTAGVRTTAGSKVFADRIPSRDATAVARLREAGADIIGKTNLNEWALGVTTMNPHYGTTRNPWDRDRIAGGSSGGSAAAVALGMGLGSVGTDTGGSVRIPAALCGLVGLKPTYGRISLHGVVPLSWSLDHAGPITRTVEDAAILMEVLAGYDPLDPCSRKIEAPAYTAALTGSIKGVRAGVPTKYFFDHVDPAVKAAVHQAIRQMERLGAEMKPVEMPAIDAHLAVWLQIVSPEAYSFHEPHLKEHADWYGAEARGRIEAGLMLRSVDYVRAQRMRRIIKEECKQIFESVDVVITPTVPIPAPRIEDAKAAAPLLTRFTRYFNVNGLPAISIPCGFTAEGLPIGLQIAGKAFDESMVLRVAYAYEQSAGWFKRRPSI